MNRYTKKKQRKFGITALRYFKHIYYRVCHYGSLFLKFPGKILDYCMGRFLYRKSPMKRDDMDYHVFSKEYGRYGEFQLWRKARKYVGKDGYWLSNVYLPKNEEQTCEIDLIAICQKGILVFESKNYSGWIYGDDNSPYWYQMIRKDLRRRAKKYTFFNPIMQNGMHCRVVCQTVGIDREKVHSLVVFGNQCSLKEMRIENKKVILCRRKKLGRWLMKLPKNALSKAEIEQIYAQLKPYTDVTWLDKQQHVSTIQNTKR